MKHAIIPTDFSIGSLQPVHDVMSYYRGQKVKITLLHLFRMPDSIGDLLFRPRIAADKYPVPEPFLHACEAVANRYAGQLAGIMPVMRYGTTCSFLENLLAGLRADGVFIQAGHGFRPPFDESVDIYSLIRRCDCSLIEIGAAQRREGRVAATIGDLLLTGS